jgi:hypothetical protein
MNLVLAGEQPWMISDDLIIAELQRVWDHVYGMKVEFAIEKGTVPFDLVSFIHMESYLRVLYSFLLRYPKSSVTIETNSLIKPFVS